MSVVCLPHECCANRYRNRFTSLALEETDESVDISPAQVALTSREDVRKPNSVDVYELEAEQVFDRAFQLFCFFEDLHRLRAAVGEVWQDCANKKINVVLATATTSAALAAIQRAESEILTAMSIDGSHENSYQEISGELFQ